MAIRPFKIAQPTAILCLGIAVQKLAKGLPGFYRLWRWGDVWGGLGDSGAGNDGRRTPSKQPPGRNRGGRGTRGRGSRPRSQAADHARRVRLDLRRVFAPGTGHEPLPGPQPGAFVRRARLPVSISPGGGVMPSDRKVLRGRIDRLLIEGRENDNSEFGMLSLDSRLRYGYRTEGAFSAGVFLASAVCFSRRKSRRSFSDFIERSKRIRRWRKRSLAGSPPAFS